MNQAFFLFTCIISSTIAAESLNITQFSRWEDVESQYQSLLSFQETDINEGCNLRAHYWSRFLESHHRTLTGKVFIFFTPEFQNRKNLRWWYHVAPFVYLRNKEGNGVSEIVFDKAHRDRPEPLNQWVQAISSEKCREGKNLEDYDLNLILGGCVIYRANRFQFTPSDLNPAARKTSWQCRDLYKVKNLLPGFATNGPNRRWIYEELCVK